jgi:hypothetical protein
VNVARWQAQFALLDLRQPWFAPYGAALEELRDGAGRGVHAAHALSACEQARRMRGLPRFVPAEDVPPAEPYELFVARTGTVPTRDNLHDLFNGLVWQQFPQAKRRLNVLQAGSIAAHGASGPRGPVRDAITLFDENGALLQAPAALWDALLARDWLRLFVGLRPLWAQARVLVFGHALLEKMVRPRKDITAHVWRVPCPGDAIAEVDGRLAGQLTAECLARKPFTPLPLLGVPGWSPQNQDFSFYDDPLVFRPAGLQDTKTTRPPAASRLLNCAGPSSPEPRGDP